MDPLPGRGATAPLALAPHLAASALGRRTFVKGLALLPGVFLPRAAAAEVTFRLGLVVPNEPQRESGRLMALGAQLGLDEANALAGFFGKRLELVQEVADTPEAVLAAGLRLARQERVVALVGGADDASAEALRDAAQQGDVLFINVGATSNRLRGARCHRHAFHMEASLAMYVDAVGEWLLDQRNLARWMLVTGNSSLGREVEQAVITFLTRRGRSAAAVERVAPGADEWAGVLQQVRRLAPDVVFVGLDTSDLLSFLRQYRAAGLSFQLAGVAADPSALLTADPEDVSGVWPLLWHHELQRFSARELNSRFRRRFGRSLEGRSWAAWAAVKLLGEAIVRTGGADLQGLLKYLEGAAPFDGHKGRPLTFREWDHQLRQPMYLVSPRRKGQGEGRWGSFEVVAEVPTGGDLDVIGEPKGESPCRFAG